MQLNKLPAQTTRSNKIVGRGHGSGKGKTSARGMNGQKSKESIQQSFEGGQLRIIKRLPFKRGVGNPAGANALIVNVGDLAKFAKGAEINVDSLIASGLVSAGDSRRRKIKILGNGEIGLALIVQLPTSKEAAKKIIAAGGQVLEDRPSSN